MKKLFLFLVFFSFTLPASALGILDFGGNGSNSDTERSSLFQTISEIQDQRQLLLATKIELEQSQSHAFPEDEEIALLSEKRKKAEEALKTEKERLSLSGEESSEWQIKLKKSLQEYAFQIQQKSDILNQKFELQISAQKKMKDDLLKIQDEISKLTAVAKQQAINLAFQILFFLGLVLLLLLLRFLSSKAICRLSGRIPPAREHALLRLNKIVFNMLIAIFLLVAMFSQVVSILPFLAILGTALAFALRDIITSFIGWFIIGTDQGYKAGDLIQVGPLRGRVIEIHPLLTVMRKTGMRGDTGRVMTFPNKKIFEEQVENFSKMYRFTFGMLDFFLEPRSDIVAAKKALFEAIQEENEEDFLEAEKILPRLQMRFGLTFELIRTQMFIEPDPRGVMLRGKYFCRLLNRHKSRTRITENFLRRVAKNPNIHLRFAELSGGEET